MEIEPHSFIFADAMPKKIHVITGPTAVGKTDTAIQLAIELGCPIISADSRQVYKELDIGVARPDAAQLAAATHYLIAHTSIHEPYNAGIYAREGRELINTLFEQYDHLIVCGGTGLYIRALLHGLDPLPGRNEALRAELALMMETKGIEALQAELRSMDPDRYLSIDIQNPQRLIRAIEILRTPMDIGPGLPDIRHEFETETKVMLCERDILYDRINRRVDMMVEAGLEDEANKLSAFRHLDALQTVGYSEWWPYFDGMIKKTKVIEKIKQHSRNYAKRQMTWMRHQV
jgi:tRNA dimethylallyltransferase